MKKLVTTLSIFLLGAMCIQAQQAPNAYIENQATKLTNKIASVGNLSKDQATKIRPFVEQFVEAKNEDTRTYANDQQGFKTAMKTERQEFKSNLQTVLSPEQMTQLTKYYKAHRKAQNGTQTPAPASQK